MRYDNHDKMRYLEWYDNYQYTKHKGYKEIFSISPSDLYTYDYTYEFIEDLEREELIQILSNLGKDIFVKEWSTRGYCQGDYIEGIAFCTKERYTKMVSNNTSDWETQIDKLIDDEIVYNGNVEDIKVDWIRAIQNEVDKMNADKSMTKHNIINAVKYGICGYPYRFYIDSYSGYIVEYPITLIEWVQGLKPGTVIKIGNVFSYHY